MSLYSRRERPMLSRWSVDNTRAPQNREWQAKVTWDDVVRMRDYAGLPFVLKGIMSPEDAARAVQVGFIICGRVVDYHSCSMPSGEERRP